MGNKYKLDDIPKQLEMALPNSLFKNKEIKKRFIDAFTKEFKKMTSNPTQYKNADAATTTIKLLKDVFTNHKDVARAFGKKRILEMIDRFKEMYGITEAEDDDDSWLADIDNEPYEGSEPEEPEENEEETTNEEQPEEENEESEEEQEETENEEEQEEQAEEENEVIDINDLDPDDPESRRKVARAFIKMIMPEGEINEESIDKAAEFIDEISKQMRKQVEETFEEQLTALRSENTALINEAALLKSKLKNIKTMVREDIETIILANMPTILRETEERIINSSKYKKYFNLIREFATLFNKDFTVLADENVKLTSALNEYKEKYEAALSLISTMLEEVNMENDVDTADTATEPVENTSTEDDEETTPEVPEAPEQLTEAASYVIETLKELGVTNVKDAAVAVLEYASAKSGGIENINIKDKEAAKEYIAEALYKIGKKIVEINLDNYNIDDKESFTEAVFNYIQSRNISEPILSEEDANKYIVETAALRKLYIDGTVNPDMDSEEIFKILDEYVSKLDSNSSVIMD